MRSLESSGEVEISRILGCVDRGLKKLGLGPAQVIYVTAGKTFGVDRHEIVTNPEQFEVALQSLLGPSFLVVQHFIVLEIVQEFGLHEDLSNLTLHEIIGKISPKGRPDTFKALPKSKTKYRNSTEIIDSILQSTRDGATKTNIMYRAYLSCTQLKEYLTLLQKRNLISFEADTQLYRITDNGMRFIEAYTKINELMYGPVELQRSSTVVPLAH
jgi:predicted transcriptional regulator